MRSTPASPPPSRCRSSSRISTAPAATCRSSSMTCRKGKVEVICGQGPAPAGATIAHYRSLGLDMMPGTGLLAACVPGMFDTWMLLLRDYGTMPLAEVLAPAIYYARERPSAGRARQCHHRHRRAAVPRALADLGRGLSAGRQSAGSRHAVHQPDARRDLSPHPARGRKRRRRPRAADRARAQLWSQGFVAEAIDRFCRTQEIMDTSGKRHRGVLTGDDMARWQATCRGAADLRLWPLHRLQGRGLGQGPVMLQQLALLKGFELDGLDPTGPDFIHRLVECSKLAFADREEFYGDPDFVEVPMRDAAVGRLQRRAPQADPRTRLARIAARARSKASARW